MDFSALHSLGKVVALDVETTGTRPWAGEIPFSIAFCDENGEHVFFRWEVDPRTREVRFPKKLRQELSNFLREDRQIITHNGKFDMSALMAAGVDVPRDWTKRGWFDTFIATKILNNSLRVFGLKDLASRFCGYPSDDEKDLLDSTKVGRRLAKANGYKVHEEVRADFWLADRELLQTYNIADVERTMLLWAYLSPAIEKEGLTEFVHVKQQVAEVATRMERRGVRVDLQRLRSARTLLQSQLREAERAMRDALPLDIRKTFNPNSPPQRSALFFDRLKLVPTEWTDKGNPSTNKEALEAMNHPIAVKVLAFMTRGKLLQFFDTWEKAAVQHGDHYRLHPIFNVVQATTMRWSCEDPNLQQVPKRDEQAMLLARSIFIPDPGHIWAPSDYSQMELCMLADMAEERAMIRAFRDGEDIHAVSARNIFPKEFVDANPKKAREIAKSINFASVYGAGSERVAEVASLPIHEAAKFLKAYKTRFAGVDRFMTSCVAEAKRRGKIRTAFNRPIHLRGKTHYKAVNYTIQGSGADVIDRAVIAVDRILPESDTEGLLLQVHDEIVPQIKSGKHVPKHLAMLKTLMEGAGKKAFKRVPPSVEVSYADKCWADKEPVLL